jgi:hypothetical protein
MLVLLREGAQSESQRDCMGECGLLPSGMHMGSIAATTGGRKDHIGLR